MMQCPSCGETDLLPKFKLCPFCGFLLPCAQNELSKVEQGIVPTTVQQSHLSTRNNSDLGVDNRQNQGENQQQDVSTTEREQPQSSTGQHPGPTQQPNKDYVGSVTVQPDDTPTEERAGLSENDQRPEYTQPTSFDQGHEDAVGSKGAGVTNTTRETIGDQTDLSDAVPSTTPSVTPPLEGQAERISCSTDPHRGNVAPGGETAVTASSTSDNTKDENSAEAVRCPAVLEGSERDADSAEPKTTSEKSSDNRSQTMPDDQRQKLVNDSERKERDMTESGEDPPTAGATTTSTTPQQKPPETQTLLGSGSETEDSKTHAQNTDTGSRGPVTRQAANRGNPNQSNKTPSSVPQHPLDKPGNDDGVTEVMN
ncbi:hypothetical protein OS493_005764 [Desmophyllum pertusum]|uniref:Uncharacterized protein n=1 Tax=Desmophyllum pertusum TaxID=174260 RepID=A0A9X0CGG9_9CNID|nr:hypothetical protein OS493_005764 [Desmophyllum pertusum]